MNKSVATFFDDIIETLSIEEESAKYADIAPEILNELYSVQNNTAAEPQAQINEPQNSFNTDIQPPSPEALSPSTAPVTHSAQSGQTAPQTPVVPAPSEPPPPAITPDALAEMDMQSLKNALMSCRQCPLHSGRKNVVFGAGNPDADLLFIGEGPGRDEDTQGVPFVGEAGQLLTKVINAMQFTRSEVYIANIVKCRPPKNRTPEENEAETCLPFLKQQIRLINPKVIVLLGAVPLLYLMNQKGITRMHGRWLEYNGIKVMPTFHPAYLLRNPAAKKDVWADMQQVMHFFGKHHSPLQKR